MAKVPEVPSRWDEPKFRAAYIQLKNEVDAERTANNTAVELAKTLLKKLGPNGDLGKKIKKLDERLKNIGDNKVDKGGVKKDNKHFFDLKCTREVKSLTEEMQALADALNNKMDKLSFKRADDQNNPSADDPWKDLNELLKRAETLRKKADEDKDKAKAKVVSVSGTGFKTGMTAFSAAVTGVKAGASLVSISLVGTRLGVTGGKTGKDYCKTTVCDAVKSAACGFEVQLGNAFSEVEAMVNEVVAMENCTETIYNHAVGLTNRFLAVQVGV